MGTRMTQPVADEPSTTTPIDVPRTVEALEALTNRVDKFPLPKEVRDRMTYRDFHAHLELKKQELSLDDYSAIARAADDEPKLWVNNDTSKVDVRRRPMRPLQCGGRRASPSVPQRIRFRRIQRGDRPGWPPGGGSTARRL